MVQRGSKLFRSLFRRQDRKRDRPLQRRPLLLESLEDRRLLATFTVTNTGDAGPGSLRQAIMDANSMPNDLAGPDLIDFRIDSPGPHTIQPRSDLPSIDDPVIIDGSTQPGFDGTPVIELDGSQLPLKALGTGITLDSGSDGSTIRALAINQFSVAGIFIGSNRNVVEGNFIGTDITGTVARANGEGVLVVLAQQNRIGGAMSAEQNLIAFNNGAGVRMEAPAFGNRIQRNSIHSNGGPGIDLNNDGVTLNDPGDGDTGPNNLRNFPVITALTVNNGTTNIEGTINSTPNTPFMLEFFRNDASDPSGFGEGQAFIGETLVTTDPTGNISFTVDFLRDLGVGEFVTATATDQRGNTSEFSAAFQNTNNPPPVNQSPVLGSIGAKSIDELTTLSFTATAGDVDIPANGLIFSLSGAVPAGASITSAGAFSWTPTAAQGPGVFSFDVVVTDDGSPNLSDRETITITVNDTGTLTVDDVNVVEGGGLTFTVKLDNAVQGGFTVDVTLADVTASGGVAPLVFPTDFNNVVARLNFSGTAGETKQFTVATLDDAVVELTETFMVSVSASNPLVDDSDTATGIIADNDSLLVEFNQSAGMDLESSGGNLPQNSVTKASISTTLNNASLIHI
ncbi:MAG: putative Ig domain-containing protein [Planctomycetia bacterium]|nr:putative Ig domain-containing protein [Planctomycetia bacterium]